MIFKNEKIASNKPPDLSKLSKREREILAFIAQGLSTPEIADRLFRSRKTIDSHRANLARKLGARNRVQLTRLAVAAGLVPAFGFKGSNDGHRENGEDAAPAPAHVFPSEQHLEVATAAKLCFWEWDVVTDACRVAPNFLMLLGYEASDFTDRGASWFKAVHPEDRAYVEAQTAKYLQSDARSYELVYRMIRSDGQARLFRVMCVVIRDAAGKARRIMGISQDLDGHAVNGTADRQRT